MPTIRITNLAVAAGPMALATGCVSTERDRRPETSETPAHRQAIAIRFADSFRHWNLGNHRAENAVINGPFAHTDSLTKVESLRYCVAAVLNASIFEKPVYASAYLQKVQEKVITVNLIQTHGLECQGKPAPFPELMELIARRAAN